MTLRPVSIPLAKYILYAATRLSTLKEYAFDFIGGLVLLPVEVFVIALVWDTIYSYTGNLGTYSLEDMIMYQLLIYSILMANASMGTVNYRVWEDIHHGNLAIYLARPVDYQLAKFFSEFGECGTKLVLRILMFLLACKILGYPILTDPFLWMIFICELFGAFVIAFLIQFIIGTMTFWWEAIFGFRDIIITFNQLMAGMLIPITILPSYVSEVASVLPFKFTLFVPAAVYLGRYSHGEALNMLTMHAFWILALFVVSRLIWRVGIRRYEAQGA